MSDSVTCDNCGKTQQAPGLVGWVTVDNHTAAVDMTQLGDPRRLPVDFCGWDCAATWTERANRLSYEQMTAS